MVRMWRSWEESKQAVKFTLGIIILNNENIQEDVQKNKYNVSYARPIRLEISALYSKNQFMASAQHVAHLYDYNCINYDILTCFVIFHLI